MSRRKNKRRKHKPNKKIPSKQQRIKQPKIIKWNKILAFLLGSATLFGALTGALALLPKVSVTTSGPLESSKPFSAPFIISNDSILPIHTITYHISPRNILNYYGGGVYFKNTIIKPGDFLVNSLGSGERFTIYIPFPIKVIPMKSVDMEIIIVYRPDFIPWKQEKHFRFYLAQTLDGRWFWFPKAMSE